MIWAIVGSRDFKKLEAIEDFVRAIIKDGKCEGIVTGDARGVDAEAKRVGELLGVPVRVFPADWQKHGKSAGVIRNSDIVAAADRILAFWDGKSRGTMDTVRKARAVGKRVDLLTDRS